MDILIQICCVIMFIDTIWITYNIIKLIKSGIRII